jgi:hypothetical protein
LDIAARGSSFSSFFFFVRPRLDEVHHMVAALELVLALDKEIIEGRLFTDISWMPGLRYAQHFVSTICWSWPRKCNSVKRKELHHVVTTRVSVSAGQ